MCLGKTVNQVFLESVVNRVLRDLVDRRWAGLERQNCKTWFLCLDGCVWTCTTTCNLNLRNSIKCLTVSPSIIESVCKHIEITPKECKRSMMWTWQKCFPSSFESARFYLPKCSQLWIETWANICTFFLNDLHTSSHFYRLKWKSSNSVNQWGQLVLIILVKSVFFQSNIDEHKVTDALVYIIGTVSWLKLWKLTLLGH